MKYFDTPRWREISLENTGLDEAVNDIQPRQQVHLLDYEIDGRAYRIILTCYPDHSIYIVATPKIDSSAPLYPDDTRGEGGRGEAEPPQSQLLFQTGV